MIMTVNSSAAGEHQLPGFHPDARYEFRIHLDGAAQEGLVYRLCFGARRGDGTQPLRLYRIAGADAPDDAAGGLLIGEGETGTELTTDSDERLRLWAGVVADPFYIDLRLLKAVAAAVKGGTRIDPDGWQPAGAQNSFGGTTINAIVIEVPDAYPELRADRQIGTWIATKLPVDGAWRQTNRQGHAMVWQIFRPDDSEYASAANSWHPSEDQAKDGAHVAERIAAVCGAYGTADPEAYGTELVRHLLPDVLPYRIGTVASFGFAGINGRGLADNAPEVMFSLVTNAAIPSGLSADVTALNRSGVFPYVVPAA
jgi:hypothetical protein